MTKTHTYQGHMSIRLNKWMAELGLCSRREAEALIAQGGVFVDDIPVEHLGHKIESGQTLRLSSEAQASIAGKFTAVLNKPVGYVSAQPEPEQIPAARLLQKKNAQDGTSGPHPSARLAPLGRLDMDSRGLLLLSEDGVLAKAIIGPHHSLDKEYIVTVTGQINAGRLTLLRNGLSLDERRLKPAIVEQMSEHVLRFVLKEGRKRQIRRMCALVGLQVTDLQRIRIGPLEIGNLSEGKWRLLTADERAALISASLPPKIGRKVAKDDRPRAPAKARRAPRRPHADEAALTRGKPGPKRSPRPSRPEKSEPNRDFEGAKHDRSRPPRQRSSENSADRSNTPSSRDSKPTHGDKKHRPAHSKSKPTGRAQRGEGRGSQTRGKPFRKPTGQSARPKKRPRD